MCFDCVVFSATKNKTCLPRKKTPINKHMNMQSETIDPNSLFWQIWMFLMEFGVWNGNRWHGSTAVNERNAFLSK